MKVFKTTITVNELIDKLSEAYRDQIKCAYISHVEFDDDTADITVVIDEDDGSDEEYDITESWFDPEDRYVDEYLDYLVENYEPDIDCMKLQY